MNQLEQYICPEIRRSLALVPNSFKNRLEEIRLRINRPLMLLGDGKEYFLHPRQGLSKNPVDCLVVTRQQIDNTLQLITHYSLYAVEEELKQGFLTLPGGHRVGLVGRILLDAKGIKGMKDFSGLNFRVSREKRGIALPLLKYLLKGTQDCHNCLIVSPPQCGKTTLLRDLIYHISNGIPQLGFHGMKVGVVDERSELGGSYQGVLQKDLGIRTDLLDCCPKASGMMMLIRAMSPQLIATDEIGRPEDGVAIQEALLAGTRVITTVHGQSMEELLHRPVIGPLLKQRIFQRLVLLSNRKGVGTIEAIYDGQDDTNLLEEPLRVAVN